MITVVKHEITLPVPMKVVKCRSVFHILSACFANNVQHPLEVCDQHKDHDSNMHPLPNLVVRVFCSEHCTDMFVWKVFHCIWNLFLIRIYTPLQKIGQLPYVSLKNEPHPSHILISLTTLWESPDWFLLNLWWLSVLPILILFCDYFGIIYSTMVNTNFWQVPTIWKSKYQHNQYLFLELIRSNLADIRSRYL